jgi:hypothetical protein
MDQPISENISRKPSGFDPGLKCLAAVLFFTVAVRVVLTLAVKSGSRELTGVLMLGVFFGLVTLIVTSCIVWTRRATSPRPGRRWALSIAIVWASLQLLVYLLIALRMLPHSIPAAGHSVEINRKTFSMSLPANWSEDTNDDSYNPNSFVFFDGPQSALFCVIIQKKSTDVSADALVNNQKAIQSKKFTDSGITEMKKWANYDGKGFKLEGKMQGVVNARFTVFGFEKADNVCLIEEYATLDDYKKYTSGFEKIRQTFKLK